MIGERARATYSPEVAFIWGNLSSSSPCRSPFFQITSCCLRLDRRIADAELVFLEPSTCAIVSSSRVYVAYVRTYVRACIMQESELRSEEYISTTGTPQAQMYSPNYLRIAVPAVLRALRRVPRRAATFSPLTLYLRRRICMECIHMKSTILPPRLLSADRFLSLSLFSPPFHARAFPSRRVFGFSLQRGKSRWGYSRCNVRRGKLVRR